MKKVIIPLLLCFIILFSLAGNVAAEETGDIVLPLPEISDEMILDPEATESEEIEADPAEEVTEPEEIEADPAEEFQEPEEIEADPAEELIEPEASGEESAEGLLELEEIIAESETQGTGIELNEKTGTSNVLNRLAQQPEKGTLSKYHCTRAEYVKLLWLAAGRPAARKTAFFKDVPANHECFSSIQYSQEKQLIGGVNGLFWPQKTITRAQAALILWKYAGKPAQKIVTSKFSDVNLKTVSKSMIRAILWCEKNGLIGGKDGVFNPKGTLTTRQAVTILYKYVLKNQTDENRNIVRSSESTVMIGDSFGRGTGGYDQKGWQYYYRLYSDVTGYFYNAGGAGYQRRGNSVAGTHPHHTFPELLEIAYQEVDNTAEVTQVVFGGGLNDWNLVQEGNADGLMQVVKQTLLRAKELFPNATIYVVPFWSDAPFKGNYITNDSSVTVGFTEEQRANVRLALNVINYAAETTPGVVSTMDFVRIMQGGYRSNGVGIMGRGDGRHVNDIGYQLLGKMLSFYLNQ